MLAALRRHPIPIAARFRHALVLTYAVPAAALEPLLAPGLEVDRFGPYGFVATALVQTEGLRPAFLPRWLGRRFFLVGHRIFVRHTTPEGVVRRGMRILRSDTDRALMKVAGNLLTHYRYRLARVRCRERSSALEIRIDSPRGEADVHVVADLSKPAPLPEGSPFASDAEARAFAGPLPWTFDYEPETRSLVQIKGTRRTWSPRPVGVRVLAHRFLERPPFAGVPAVLAQAFHVADLDYRWERGIRERIGVPA
jgi:hypothetical protein